MMPEPIDALLSDGGSHIRLIPRINGRANTLISHLRSKYPAIHVSRSGDGALLSCESAALLLTQPSLDVRWESRARIAIENRLQIAGAARSVISQIQRLRKEGVDFA